jgi:DNA polymerase III delta subunit
MLTAKEALKNLESKSNKKTAYFLYGEDSFKIQEFLDKALGYLFPKNEASSGSSDFSLEKMDGSESSGSDVLDAAQTLGLFGSNKSRVILVRNAHLMKQTDGLYESLSQEDPFGDNIVLFVSENLDARKKLHQLFKKKDLAIEFKKSKDHELIQWIQYLAQKKNLLLQEALIAFLAAASQGSLEFINQELEKISLFVQNTSETDSRRPISFDQVENILSIPSSGDVVELVHAILEGKRARALLLVEKKGFASDEVIQFVGFLTWAIKYPRKLGVRIQTPFYRLEKIAKRLLDLDEKIKTSGVDPRGLLERFLIELD